MASSSMCGTASRAARAFASVDLPDPEFPTTDTRLMTGPAYLVAIRDRAARPAPTAFRYFRL
jgi:hypothetical protein